MTCTWPTSGGEIVHHHPTQFIGRCLHGNEWMTTLLDALPWQEPESTSEGVTLSFAKDWEQDHAK